MRLIDADALYNSRPEYLNPQHETNGEYNRGWNACNEHYSELIRNAPTADVVEVVHGWWTENEICTICGGSAWYYDWEQKKSKSRYCPNCGAKMDGTQ